MILESPEKDFYIVEQNMQEDKIIQILAEKVQAYLDSDINLLMSYLYRLDVLEKNIKKALSNFSDEPGNIVLAKLIWERQKTRLETKKSYQSEQMIDEDWKW